MKVWMDHWRAGAFDPDEHPELGLTAVQVRGPFGADGWVVPVATAAEFQRLIEAWADNDPNGTWNPFGISQGDGALIYEYELGRFMWSVVGVDDAGVPLYALDGWTWFT